MIGGGVELRALDRRLGVRVSIEDYLLRIDGLPCESFGLQSYCESNPRQARRLRRPPAGRPRPASCSEENFWAARFGMVVDRFGIPWLINCEGSEQPQEG